jgi:hypothetical protein
MPDRAFVRFIHFIASDGRKSTTLIDSIFAPCVAAIIAVFACTTVDTDAVCSQCDPNGSHW